MTYYAVIDTIAMEKQNDDAYLVTGKRKHYSNENFIITLTEMMETIEKNKR